MSICVVHSRTGASVLRGIPRISFSAESADFEAYYLTFFNLRRPAATATAATA